MTNNTHFTHINKLILATLTILFLTAFGAAQQSYTVDPADGTGDYSSIQDAVEAVTDSGSTITVQDGTYNENVLVANGIEGFGGDLTGLTIQAAEGASPEIIFEPDSTYNDPSNYTAGDSYIAAMGATEAGQLATVEIYEPGVTFEGIDVTRNAASDRGEESATLETQGITVRDPGATLKDVNIATDIGSENDNNYGVFVENQGSSGSTIELNNVKADGFEIGILISDWNGNGISDVVLNSVTTPNHKEVGLSVYEANSAIEANAVTGSNNDFTGGSGQSILLTGASDAVSLDGPIQVEQGDSIQTAVNAAATGAKINVGSGTYSESVTVDKEDLTIEGSGSSSTTITRTPSSPSGDATLDIQAPGATVSDIEVERVSHPDRTTDGGYSGHAQGIVVRDGTSNKGIQISDVKVTGDMNGNNLERFDGIVVLDSQTSSADNVDISRTTVEGFYAGVVTSTFYSESGGVSDVTVTDSVLKNNRDGVVVKQHANPVTAITVENSELTNNDNHGLFLPANSVDYQGYTSQKSADASEVTVTNNVITGNSVQNGNSNTLVATNNYWGDRLGPYNGDNPRDSSTSGVSVSDNINFKPWYTDSGLTTLSSDVLYSYSIDYSGDGNSDVVTSGDNLELSFTDATDLAGETFAKLNEEITVSTSTLAGYSSDTSVDVDFSSSTDSDGVENNVEILTSDQASSLENQDDLSSGVTIGTEGTETSADANAQSEAYILVDQDGPLVSSQEPLNPVDNNQVQINFSVSDSQPSNVGSINSVTLKDSEGSPVGGIDSVTDSNEHVSFSGTGGETADIEIDPAFDGATDNFTMPEGEMTIEVQATDEYGNQETDSFTFVVDTETPTLKSVQKGQIVNSIDVTFEDTNSGLNPDTIEASDFRVSGTDVSYTVSAPGSIGDTSLTPTLEFDSNIESDQVTVVLQEDGIEDSAGNALVSGSGTAEGMDTVHPQVSKVETVDKNVNGRIDRLRVSFTETVQKVDSSDISITDEGVSVSSAESSSGSEINFVVDSDSNTEGAQEIEDTSTTPTVSFNEGNIADSSGNTLADTSDATAIDNARPQVDSASYTDSDSDGTIDKLSVTFSEEVSADGTVDGGDFTLLGGVEFGSTGVPGTGTYTPDSEKTLTLELNSDYDIPSEDTAFEDTVYVLYDNSGSLGHNSGVLTDNSVGGKNVFAGGGEKEINNLVDDATPVITGVEISDSTDANGLVKENDEVEVKINTTEKGTDMSKVSVDTTSFNSNSPVEITSTSDGDSDYSASFTVGTPVDSESAAATISATDAAGNGGSQAVSSNVLTVDNTEPSVDSVEISDNSDSNGIVAEGDEVLVELNATDDTSGIDTVSVDTSSFNSNDSLQITETDSESASDYTATFIAGTLGDTGSATVSVSATDEATNGGSQSVTSTSLEVDNTAPDVSTQNVPIDPASITGAVDVENYFTSQDSDVENRVYEYRVSDSEGFQEVQDSDTTEFDTTEFITGVTLEFRATDTDDAGNTGSATTSELTVDNQEPVIGGVEVVDSDSNGAVNSGETVDIAINLTEEYSGVSEVTVNYSEFVGGSDSTLTLSTSGISEGEKSDYVGSFDAGSPGEDGEKAVTVSATDGVDNGGTQAVESKTLTVDNSAPTVESAAYRDSDNDGTVDTVDVEFNEEVSYSPSDTISDDWATSNDLPGFSIDSHNSGASSDATVTLNVSVSEGVTGTSGTEPSIDVASSSGVTDTAGNTASASSEVSMVDEADPVVDFSSGMNMVSFPSKVGVYELDTLLDNSDNVNSDSVDAVWRYTSSGWESYSPDRTSSENDFSKVEGGHGYIVEASESGKIVADVDQGDEEQRSASGVELTSSQPWHLVGVYQESHLSNLANAGNGLETDVGQVLERDGSGSFQTTSSLSPGDGYWVSVNSDRSYNPLF